jgi:hypothetical protein
LENIFAVDGIGFGVGDEDSVDLEVNADAVMPMLVCRC